MRDIGLSLHFVHAIQRLFLSAPAAKLLLVMRYLYDKNCIQKTASLVELIIIISNCTRGT